MYFSLPYVAGISDYVDSLPKEKRQLITDIYFSDTRLSTSARYAWYENDDIDNTKWLELLDIKHKHGIEPQYVINPSVWNNDVYTTGMQGFINVLDKVWSAGCRWLTLNNPLLLRMPEFRDNIPPFNIKLSINNHISTLEEVQFTHDTIGINHLILDRSINRNIDELKRICTWAKTANITITLLAQEGCIVKCQWKNTCDNMISTHHLHDKHEVNDTQNIHTLHLCTRYYNDRPADVLKSPWILPSMLNMYTGLVDCIKLSGRERLLAQIKDSFDAYLYRSNNIQLNKIIPKCSNMIGGMNLLNLEEHAADSKWINCKNRCADCDFCDKIYEQYTSK
jgi:collagenase-like PrtC family protease